MKAGDILFPTIRKNTRSGQLTLPLWGDSPCVLIERKLYVSDDENDCQSDGIEAVSYTHLPLPTKRIV